MQGFQLPPIKSFKDYSTRIKRDLKCLPPEIKSQFEAVLFELENGALSRGRRLEKVDNAFTVRLDQKFRLAFSIHNGDTVEFLAVGIHDQVYGYVNRTRIKRKSAKHRRRVRNR